MVERDPSPYASRSGERFSTNLRKVLQEWKTQVPSHNFKVPEGGLSEHCLIASLGAACDDAASRE